MADGERHYIRPGAVVVDVDGRVGFGERDIFLDCAHDVAGRGNAERGRDVYAGGHDRLHDRDRIGERDGKQGDADHHHVANGKRDHLWPDTDVVNADGRVGIDDGNVCVDYTHDSAGRGNAERRRNLYTDGYHRLQHSDWIGERDGGQGDADDRHVANGKRDHLWPDAGIVNADGRVGIDDGNVCVDYTHDGARRGNAERGRDLYTGGCRRLQHGDGVSDRDGEPGDADHHLERAGSHHLWHGA